MRKIIIFLMLLSGTVFSQAFTPKQQEFIDQLNERIVADSSELVTTNAKIVTHSDSLKMIADSLTAVGARTVIANYRGNSYSWVIKYPQVSDVFPVVVEQTFRIDSIAVQSQVANKVTDYVSWNLWYYPQIISGIANYVFNSTQTTAMQIGDAKAIFRYPDDFSQYTLPETGMTMWINIAAVNGQVSDLFITVFGTRQ